MLECIYDSTAHIVEDVGGWKHAFLDDGFGAMQARLSGFRRKQLELDAVPELGAGRPSAEQVKLCFPQRQRVPPASLLFKCPALLPPLAARAAAAPSPAPSGVPRGVRLPGRGSSVASSMALAVGVGGASSGAVVPAFAAAGRAPRTRSDHRWVALAKASPPGA